MPGFVLWFTGLSGSGKSTLAALVSAELRRRGVHVETLDGDEIRRNLSKGLGFSKEDRDANVRRLGFVARLIARSGGCAVTAAISPYREVRDEVRATVERFCEVFCDCPVPVLAARDPKGLYAKALRGEIRNFTGVDDPYEAPPSAEVHLRTDAESPSDSAQKILQQLEALGFIESQRGEARLAPFYGGEGPAEVLEPGSATPPSTGSQLVLDSQAELACVALGLGLCAPLNGFMGARDAFKVRGERHLERGLPWPSPLLLAGRAPVQSTLALVDAAGARLGRLHVSEAWQEATSDFVAGRVWLERLPLWAKACVSSNALRAQEASSAPLLGLPLWQLPTLADEHRARAALELGHRLVLLPLVSPELGEQLVTAARLLVARYFDASRVTIAPLPLPPGAAHDAAEYLAIYAQNIGISRLLLDEHWLEQHQPSGASLLASPSLVVTLDALPELFFDEQVGGWVSARSRSVGAQASAPASQTRRAEIAALEPSKA